MDTPQIDDVALWLGGVAGALLAISGLVVLGKRWLIGDLKKDLDEMKGQLRRNGGTSLRDAIDRIEDKQAGIATDVRELRQRLDDHIAYHLDKEL